MSNFDNWLDAHVGHMTLEEKIALGRRYGVPHPRDPHPELARKKTQKEEEAVERTEDKPTIDILTVIAILLVGIGIIFAVKFVL